MANSLYAHVFYQDTYAGILAEEPGGRISFTHDEDYLNSDNPAIAYTLPLSPKPYISPNGLHPFFDNLVQRVG